MKQRNTLERLIRDSAGEARAQPALQPLLDKYRDVGAMCFAGHLEQWGAGANRPDVQVVNLYLPTAGSYEVRPANMTWVTHKPCK
jgi:hypothetical protein